MTTVKIVRTMTVAAALTVLLGFGDVASAADPVAMGDDVQGPVRVEEMQKSITTEGTTYEQYITRQVELSNWLVSEIQAAAFERPLRVELTPGQINEVEQASSPMRIGAVTTLAPAIEVTGAMAGQPQDTRGVFNPAGDGGYIWTFVVTSTNAGAFRMHIENMSLPDNASLYLFSRIGESFGPFNGRGPNGTGEFWTESVFGNEAVLQLRVQAPVTDETLKAISFQLTEVGTILPQFTDSFLRANFPCDNPSCVVDATCSSGANSIKDAYAKMEWIAGAFINTCTGALLVDNNPTQNNYFLTANHCFNKSSTAANVQFYWRFRTAACNGTCPSNSGWPYKTVGAAVRSTNRKADYTLCQLNSNPPAGSVLLGWTSAAVANTNGVALHRVSNPNFGPQVYSEQTVNTSATTCTGWPRGERIYSRTTLGGTDGGSSGGPVVNSSDQVVGQLTGACGTNVSNPCNHTANATVDGAFAFYYNTIKPFINP